MSYNNIQTVYDYSHDLRMTLNDIDICGSYSSARICQNIKRGYKLAAVPVAVHRGKPWLKQKERPSRRTLTNENFSACRQAFVELSLIHI